MEKVDAVASRPDRRMTAPLVINRNGPRKDLFTGRESKRELGVDHKGHEHSTAHGTSPQQPSGIPRPIKSGTSSGQKQFTLKDAYRMATEEEAEAIQGSPSPAPRPWRSRTTSVGDKSPQSPTSYGGFARGETEREARQHVTGTPERDAAVSSVEIPGSVSESSEAPGRSVGKNLKEGRKQQVRGDQDLGQDAPATPRLRSTVARPGRILAKKESESDSGRDPSRTGYQPWGVKAKSSPGWLKRIMDSANENAALGQTLQKDSAGHEPDVPRTVSTLDTRRDHPDLAARNLDAVAVHLDTNKSFAWQADEDFTAGDVQVSDSPPVKSSSSSARTEVTRDGRIDANKRSFESNKYRSRNGKIDEIMALEAEAAARFPEEALEDHIPTQRADRDNGFKARYLARTNHKIDEIRSLEMEPLSKKDLAATKLEEIREANARFHSKTLSPDVSRKTRTDGFRDLPGLDTGPLQTTIERITVQEDEPVLDPPATIFRRPASTLATTERDDLGPTGSISRDSSHELLRQLSRAASNSPAPLKEQTVSARPKASRHRTGSDKSEGGSPEKKPASDKAADDPKPRVGFAGLRREPSAESTSDKRSSLALSDSDPTERIARELQLFEPQENFSEKGSIRAPSPESDDAEETPKPARTDPPTLPTPKVTGAYVETPVTVKVEKFEDIPRSMVIERGQSKSTGDKELLIRGRRPHLSSERSAHSLSVNSSRGTLRPSSVLRGRRVRSLPRVRPRLSNSARPPTVKDDLLEIHKAHQIEDSTLDDFNDFLAVQQNTSPEAQKKDTKGEGTREECTMQDQSRRENKELEAYDRMNRALKTGLLGIRTAKRGIERLEDKVSNAEVESSKPQDTHSSQAPCPICLASPPSNTVAYLHLPIPRLWRRQPTFQFTLLGLVIFVVSLWSIAESAMCMLYCKPASCYPGQPCAWSHDDPTWGYAIPVKLDQWTTGGRGRALATKWGIELEDWSADVWDAMTGTDLLQIDPSQLTWEQRKRHRRRLMKHGLIKPTTLRYEDKEKYDAWSAAAAAEEKAAAYRAMGYVTGEDESMMSDEAIRGS
ncbi:hypothetical protein VTK73DRAFT_361 [Phialemonium thermophilum]|uniref:C3H1-type domain-containing protein n=1 Tax=Phialemonium thermophilum TaxID=223376 RepID=A0ABR3XEL2_9PEZI